MKLEFDYPIGELARMSGVSAQALRLYERKGLVKPIRRKSNGYRAYDVAALLRVESIKQLQGVGFTLGEMREIFSDTRQLWENPKMRMAVQKKLKEVRKRIQDLRLIESGLKNWDGKRP